MKGWNKSVGVCARPVVGSFSMRRTRSLSGEVVFKILRNFDHRYIFFIFFSTFSPTSTNATTTFTHPSNCFPFLVALLCLHYSSLPILPLPPVRCSSSSSPNFEDDNSSSRRMKQNKNRLQPTHSVVIGGEEREKRATSTTATTTNINSKKQRQKHNQISLSRKKRRRGKYARPVSVGGVGDKWIDKTTSTV